MAQSVLLQGQELDVRVTVVRFPTAARDFSFPHHLPEQLLNPPGLLFSVYGGLYPRKKSDYSLLSSNDVKDGWNSTSLS
jgi:hypothetical protein